jgi:hypothetical protein
MNFPVHELRIFLAALVRWAADYPPPPRAVHARFIFGHQRPITSGKGNDDVPT